MKRFLLRVLTIFLLSTAFIAGWAALDINYPHKIDIRDFDPDEVARLDTAMWRSYYSRQRLKLFCELTGLLDKQYKLRFWRRQRMAFYAAKAAFVFKDGHSRTEYEQALPNLEKFYGEVRDISTTEFDIKRAARLELEWWIVHRDRKQYGEGDLARALAEAASAVYNPPAERFAEYGDLRARAMNIRDSKAEQGGLAEEDWTQIDELLHRSWRSLHNVVNEK